VGFLDRAKKLAEQAKGVAEGAIAEAKAKAEQLQATSQTGAPPASSPSSGPRSPSGAGSGTPYVPGMLGRPGWRERQLEDPAAVLPIAERDRAGVPRSTKSQIVEEPYGMGRRWSAGAKSAALFYQLYPEQQAWQPPTGTAPLPEVGGASMTSLPDGRTLVFLGTGDRKVVLEVAGLDDGARAQLARSVAEQLA
jgi:hypothetical protein